MAATLSNRGFQKSSRNFNQQPKAAVPKPKFWESLLEQPQSPYLYSKSALHKTQHFPFSFY
jgi:hypothetical protein